MNAKILEFLKNPYKCLVWAIICGLAYAAIIAQFVMRFTNTKGGGIIILWCFFPAIICGAALLLVKTVKNAYAEERDKAVTNIFYSHLLIIAMGIVFFAAFFV